jgi:hypothetical protein
MPQIEGNRNNIHKDSNIVTDSIEVDFLNSFAIAMR